MSAADVKVNELLLRHARDVYTDQPRTPQTVPLDRRCDSCGVDRPVCGSPTCVRRVAG